MEYQSHFLLGLLLLLTLVFDSHSAPSSRRSRAAAYLTEESNPRESKLMDKFKEAGTTTSAPPSNRKNKALGLFGYFPSFLSSGLDYTEDDDEDVTFAVNDDNFDEDDLSRTIPSRRRNQNKKKNGNNNYQSDNINSLQYDNSPIFYIRIPPTPYMFVPGLGYVSQPPNIGPSMGPMPPQGPPQVGDPFVNLPLDYVSNAKPVGVYQWGSAGYPQVEQMPINPYYGSQPMMPPQPNYNVPSYSKPRPKPSSSKVTNLKGQYVFNGKPGDSVSILRDTYNSIYSDALQNFYP